MVAMDRKNSNYHTEDTLQDFSPKIILKNVDLWNQFHSLGTEMILTKTGRRMFPSLSVQIFNLDPNAMYMVFVEMTPVSNWRYKYSSSSGWTPAGSDESQSSQRIYIHPESPSPGEHWMSQPISFGRMKLTNTISAPNGQIVLSSMHKYLPKIVIVKAADFREVSWAPTKAFVFPETEFIAVTAYQNEKITQLKIDHNPFAKGFRENGLSKKKRKRDFQDSSSKSDSDSQEERTVNKVMKQDSIEERTSSPDSIISDTNSGSGRGLSVASPSKSSCCDTSKTHPDYYYSRFYNPYYPAQFYYPYHPFYGYGFMSHPVEATNGAITTTHPSYECCPNTDESKLSLIENRNNFDTVGKGLHDSFPFPKFDGLQTSPRKLTDFSIKAITGLPDL